MTKRYRKVSASGNHVLLHPSLWKLPKTVERFLVASKSTAAEANEWGDDLDQKSAILQLASLREFRNNSDDVK
jgi:hypothetical protein